MQASTLLQTDNHTSTPPLSFLQAGCPSCRPTNSVKALKENINSTVNLKSCWCCDDICQVLAGDLEEAICLHAVYYTLWLRFNALPERYNWQMQVPEVLFYPLRPEFIESTYYLYRATKNPFYLHVGMDVLNSLNNYTKVQ